MKRFIDFLNNTYLFEMAFERKEALNKIRSLQPQINRHILKIFLYPKEQANNHWQDEVVTWLLDIAETDIKKSKLKQQDYYNLLFDEPFNNPPDTIQRLYDKLKSNIELFNRQGYKNNIDIDTMKTQKLYNKLLIFYTIISKKMSMKTLYASEIYKMLDEIKTLTE